MDWAGCTDALGTITGPGAVFYGSEHTPSLAEMAKILCDGRPMTAGTGGIPVPAHPGIVGERLYIVDSVDERRSTVTVVNPWAGHDIITMTYQHYVQTFAGTSVGRAVLAPGPGRNENGRNDLGCDDEATESASTTC